MKKNSLRKKIVLLSLLTSLGTCTFNNTVYAKEGESPENPGVITVNNKTRFISPEKVKYYSDVFGIEEKAIYDYIENKYKENEDEDYLNMSSEFQILNAARNLYYSYDESIRTNIPYEPTLEIEEMVEKYSDLYDINKEVALSIVYCECGSDVDSYNYNVNNNPAGLGPYMYFENKEIGVIYFIDLLKYDYGCTRDSGTEFLSRIASTYCENPSHWLDLTTPFYYNLVDDYYYKKPELRDKKEEEKRVIVPTKTLKLEEKTK